MMTGHAGKGRDGGPVRLAFDRGTLVLAGLGKAGIQRLFGPDRWAWDGRVGAWRGDAMGYREVAAALNERLWGPFDDEVPRPPSIRWPRVDLPALRPEQREALQAWREAEGRGLVVMPTGTGKTEVALAAMAESGAATLVVAPVRDLMYQWHRRILRGLGYDAGIVGDNLFNLKPVTVTTYDSAYIHMGRIGADFDLVVFDEAHHLPGPSRREAALMCAAPRRLGLTATPQRADGREADLDTLLGPIVYRLPLAKVRGRTLAEYNVIRIPVALSPSEQARYDASSRLVRAFIASRRKDKKAYSWKDLCAESGTDPEARRTQRAYYAKKAVEDRAAEKLRVLEDLFRLHVGEQIIVFAGSNAMAMDVSRRFLIPSLLAHSRKRERLQVLEGFAEGRFPAIVANQVLDEGVDVPAAKVAVVIGGLGSTRQAQQRLGRILRKTGHAPATLYEVVCQDTKEVERSRRRRRSDAYKRTRHRRL